jgi:hypothetical protein
MALALESTLARASLWVCTMGSTSMAQCAYVNIERCDYFRRALFLEQLAHCAIFAANASYKVGEPVDPYGEEPDVP